jgi:hypothetical protein
MTRSRFLPHLLAAFALAAVLLAVTPAQATTTCGLPTTCMPYYEAYAHGWMSGASLSSGRARIYNAGRVAVCLDDFLFWSSKGTQTAFIDDTTVGQPAAVIAAGGYRDLYYGSYTGPGGPYPYRPRWWCAESGQYMTAGQTFDWYGDTTP